MTKRAPKRRKRSKARATTAAVIVLGVLGAGGWWLWPGAAPLASGPPRLVLDRTEIDLGPLRFETSAYAAFTVTNAGGGLLTLTPGRVRAVQGC